MQNNLCSMAEKDIIKWQQQKFCCETNDIHNKSLFSTTIYPVIGNPLESPSNPPDLRAFSFGLIYPKSRLRTKSKLHKFKNNKTKTCLHKLINKSISNVNVADRRRGSRRRRQRHGDKFKYITGSCELQISQSSHSLYFYSSAIWGSGVFPFCWSL